MQKLGLGPVRRSTLADANEVRPVQILEELFQYTLHRARLVAPKKDARFKFVGDVYALDSTTIELCLKLSPWASSDLAHSRSRCSGSLKT